MSKRTKIRRAYGGPRLLTPRYYRRHFGVTWGAALRLWRGVVT